MMINTVWLLVEYLQIISSLTPAAVTVNTAPRPARVSVLMTPHPLVESQRAAPRYGGAFPKVRRGERCEGRINCSVCSYREMPKVVGA